SSSPPHARTKWSARSENFVATRGRISLNGAPVSGVRLRVDLYGLPAPTDAQGRFVYQADATRLARHVISVADMSAAKVGSTPLSGEDKSALARLRSSISVAYPIHDLRATRDHGGRPVLTGRIS